MGHFGEGLFRASPVAYGGSQVMGWIGAVAAMGSELCLWTKPQLNGNDGSLTHWARPGIEPQASWVLVCFPSRGPQRDPPFFFFFFFFLFCPTCSMWKFMGQRPNLCHSSDPCCCSENTRSLTCCATKELQREPYSYLILCSTAYLLTSHQVNFFSFT